MTQQTSAFHNRCLLAYGEALAKENLPVEFFDANEDIPYDMVLVGLESESGALYRFELGFLPELEEDMENVSLLQVFVPMAERGEDADVAQLDLLMSRLNTQLPQGHFGYLEDNNVVYYRYVLMVPNEIKDALTMVVQTFWMMAYILEQVGDRLLALAGAAEESEETP